MPTANRVSNLSWSLVIPTYQRQSVLLQCLHCAVQQTVPPQQIIVVDASPNWYQTCQLVLSTLAKQHADIEWHYLCAEQISSAAQRNQGIRYANAEVVFFIDDDSWLYPECAEKVLAVYAADTQQQVAGVMPLLTPLAPASNVMSSKSQKTSQWWQFSSVIGSQFRGFAKKLIQDDNIFIPYQFTFPTYQVPQQLAHLAVHTVPLMHGARMTFRRTVLQHVKFEETLQRYAVNEDNDVCYRASYHGMLLQVLDAHIYHLHAQQARLSRFTTTTLWGWNQALLHRLHSPDLNEFRKRFSRLIWRRLLTQTVKDLLELRWTFPSTRGILNTFWHYEKILNCPIEKLRHWYPAFQQALIQREQNKLKLTHLGGVFGYNRNYRKISSSGH